MMKKFFLSSLIFCLLSVVIFWSYAFSASFLKIVGKPNLIDFPGYSSITNDNNILLCRGVFPYCLKLNRNGDILWKKEIAGLTLTEGLIRQLKNNYFVVEGQALNFAGQQILSILDDTTLTSKWTYIFPELTSNLEDVHVIDVINDNYLLMIRKKRENTENTFDVLISEISSTGDLIWAKKILMPDNFLPLRKRVQKTSDGNYIISGGLYYYPSFFSLIKINKNGDILFSKKYTGDGTIIVDSTGPQDLTELADGSYILVGEARLSSGKYGSLLLKVDPNGNLIKAKFLSPGFDLFLDKVSSDSTGFIVAGTAYIIAYKNYPCLIKMTNNLELQWSKIYSNLSGQFMTVDYIPDEGYVAGGFVAYENNYYNKLLLVKTDLNGSIDNCSSISDINLQVMDVTSHIKTEEMNLSVTNSSLQVERYSGTISLSQDVNLDIIDACYASSPTPPPPSPSPTPPSPTPPPPSSPFTDIPSDFWAINEITWAKNKGITKGYPDGTYRPYEPVKRDAMAAFIVRVLFGDNPTCQGGVPCDSTQPYFKDVDQSQPFFRHIQKLKEAGITKGWPDGTYRPYENIRRDAMAAFLIRALGHGDNPICNRGVPCENTQPYFMDVPPTHPFYKHIQKLKELGITEGCQTNPPMYCPDSYVRRDEAAVFLYRAFSNK